MPMRSTGMAATRLMDDAAAVAAAATAALQRKAEQGLTDKNGVKDRLRRAREFDARCSQPGGGDVRGAGGLALLVMRAEPRKHGVAERGAVQRAGALSPACGHAALADDRGRGEAGLLHQAPEGDGQQPPGSERYGGMTSPCPTQVS